MLDQLSDQTWQARCDGCGEGLAPARALRDVRIAGRRQAFPNVKHKGGVRYDEWTTPGHAENVAKSRD